MVKKYNGTYMPNIDIYGKPSKYFMEVPRVLLSDGRFNEK